MFWLHFLHLEVMVRLRVSSGQSGLRGKKEKLFPDPPLQTQLSLTQEVYKCKDFHFAISKVHPSIILNRLYSFRVTGVIVAHIQQPLCDGWGSP